MKKKIPILTASIAALIPTFIPCVASCSKWKWNNSNCFEIEVNESEVILNGFKKEVSQETIVSIFNDTLTIPSNVTRIGRNAFYDLETKTSLIPSSIKNLAFADNSKISVFDNYAFTACPFEHIQLPSTLTSVGVACFENSNNLLEVKFNTPLEGTPIRLALLAFSNCANLEKINFPKNHGAYIGDELFSHCPKLKTIDLTQLDEVSLAKAKDMFFESATEGAEITIDCDVKSYQWQQLLESEGLIFSGDKPSTFKYDVQLYNITKNDDSEYVLNGWSNSETCTDENKQKYLNDTLIIPDNISVIAENAFYSATTNASKMPSFLTKIKWDSEKGKLREIGANAFNGWSGLKQLKLDPKVKTIGSNAFANCSNLNDINVVDWRIDLPDTTKWGNSIFSNLATNGKITILIEENKDQWNTLLTSKGIDFSKWQLNPLATIYTFDETKTELKGFNSLLTLEDIGKIFVGKTSIEIPQSTTIGKNAFYSIDTAKSLIPSFITDLDLTKATNLTEIKSNVFEKSSIATITGQPTTLKTLGSGCFQQTEITTFDFTNIQTIGFQAFNQTKLKTVDLSSSAVTKIEGSAFANIKTLESFTFPSNLIDDNIGSSVLGYNTNLVNVKNWPTTLTTIKNSTFSGCKYLVQEDIESIINSTNLTTIGAFAFEGCEQIKTLKIPSHITTIGQGAFKNCNYLTTIDFSAVDADIPEKFDQQDTFKGLPSAGKIIVNKLCTNDQLTKWEEYFKGFGMTFGATNWTISRAE